MQRLVIFVKKNRVAAHGTCNLRYNVPKKIPIAFPDGSNYEYHFIIKT